MTVAIASLAQSQPNLGSALGKRRPNDSQPSLGGTSFKVATSEPLTHGPRLRGQPQIAGGARREDKQTAPRERPASR